MKAISFLRKLVFEQESECEPKSLFWTKKTKDKALQQPPRQWGKKKIKKNERIETRNKAKRQKKEKEMEKWNWRRKFLRSVKKFFPMMKTKIRPPPPTSTHVFVSPKHARETWQVSGSTSSSSRYGVKRKSTKVSNKNAGYFHEQSKKKTALRRKRTERGEKTAKRRGLNDSHSQSAQRNGKVTTKLTLWNTTSFRINPLSCESVSLGLLCFRRGSADITSFLYWPPQRLFLHIVPPALSHCNFFF